MRYASLCEELIKLSYLFQQNGYFGRSETVEVGTVVPSYRRDECLFGTKNDSQIACSRVGATAFSRSYAPVKIPVLDATMMTISTTKLHLPFWYAHITEATAAVCESIHLHKCSSLILNTLSLWTELYILWAEEWAALLSSSLESSHFNRVFPRALNDWLSLVA